MKIVINLLLGPLLLLIVLIFWSFPPKKINRLYGYRTSRSVASQEAWKASNHYSSKLILWFLIVTCICQIVFYQYLSEPNAILSTSAVMVTLLLTIIPMTEKYLKDHFDDEGKPKNQ